MASLHEEMLQKRSFAIASLKEAKAFKRYVQVEAVGIEKLSLGKESQECLKVYFEGVFGYIPKSKIDDYDFYSIDSFVNTNLEVLIEEIISDEHKTYFLANREAALEVQANIFWNRGRKGDVVSAYVSGVDKMNVYLLVNGVRCRMAKEDYSFRYVRDLREVVERGQELDVKIVEFNGEEKKIHVSHRILEGDPRTFLDEYTVGSRYGATINNIDPETGVFVSLKPHGITALAALPSLSIGKNIKVGDLVNIHITRKDEEKGFIYGRLIVPRVGQIRKAQRG
ncbi:MAG: 30S ribosomal protein S1 [Kurthia sp.]|nr:30S ribosomal protein S1 [Candidatus Kurthia equi]